MPKDELLMEVKKLISLGKEKGYLTYEEVNSKLPAEMVSSEQLGNLMTMFGEMDIEILDTSEGDRYQKVARPGAVVREAEEAEVLDEGEKEIDLTPGVLSRTDDPVRLYLKEMGSVALLSREGEIEIAKRIEEADVLRGQRSAERGNHIGDTALVQHDGIEIALNDHQGTGLARRSPCPIQPIERTAFFEDRGIRGIQVLGQAVAEDPSAEGDHTAPKIDDRKHEASTKAVVVAGSAFPLRGIVLPGDRQPRCSQVLLPDASLREGLDEPIPGWQRQAKPERLRRVLRDAAQRQIRPRLSSDLGVEQVSPEPLRCRLIDLPNALSLRLILGRLACGRNRDGHPRLPRQLPERFAESEILSFHQECENVSTHPAPKAMEHLSGWTDGKGRSLLRMEWTETFQVLARSGQGYVAGHHVGDVRPLLNLLNELLGNEALAH